MARLNPGRVINHASMSDNFTVVSQVERTDSDTGRSTFVQTQAPGVGVVTMASPSDLRRLPDSQTMERVISIVSTSPLQGPTPQRQPDIVIWRGDGYIVQDVQPYPQYGIGFYQVLACILGATNNLPLPPGVGDV